jgi:hypothetical protein
MFLLLAAPRGVAATGELWRADRDVAYKRAAFPGNPMWVEI